jgi:AraC-like DNA-binding protein
MNTKLPYVQDWPELARHSKWSAATLAKQCGVSLRTLERYFLKQFRSSPKKWLSEKRQHTAVQMLRGGYSVKEVASYLGYQSQAHFSREFKKHWGLSPTRELEKSAPALYVSGNVPASPLPLLNAS